ncbi:MAG: DUF4878 domain-containing protein [Ferruginibacter sp.]|nr:DUF4878 domain-containing protein [Ferruginibacter sp.]
MKKLLVMALAFSTLYINSCKSGGGDPKAVLTSFFDAMAKKDIAAARKIATADSKATFDLMEMGMKMMDNVAEDKTNEQFDKSKMEMGEAKIDGDRATINVKEKKSGDAVDFVLKKEGGEWKVAMDMTTMMNMGDRKMKQEGITDEQMGDMKEEMEKFKNMNVDSLKEIMNKGIKALDTLKKALDKK